MPTSSITNINANPVAKRVMEFAVREIKNPRTVAVIVVAGLALAAIALLYNYYESALNREFKLRKAAEKESESAKTEKALMERNFLKIQETNAKLEKENEDIKRTHEDSTRTHRVLVTRYQNARRPNEQIVAENERLHDEVAELKETINQLRADQAQTAPRNTFFTPFGNFDDFFNQTRYSSSSSSSSSSRR